MQAIYFEQVKLPWGDFIHEYPDWLSPVGFLLIFLQLIEIPMQLQGIFSASELA